MCVKWQDSLIFNPIFIVNMALCYLQFYFHLLIAELQKNKWVQIWTRTYFVFRIKRQYTKKVHCVGGGELCIL